MNSINVGVPSFQMPQYIEAPFDIKRAVFEASSIGGNIYIHPLLFSSFYGWISQNIDRPFSIDPHGYGVGSMKIIVTDLLPENEYSVLTELDFIKKYNDKI